MITVSRRRGDEVDPFSVLAVQTALGRVLQRIAEVESDADRFARAHHVHALRLAYDGLIEEACRLAGVDVRELPEDASSRRVVAEAELGSRGWSW